MIQVLSRKYFSEWANGTSFSSSTSDYATHLKGSVGEKLKFVSRVRASLFAIAEDSSPFNYNNSQVLSRSSGSWLQDGFHIGQTFAFIENYTSGTPTVIVSGTIAYLNDTELEFSGLTGSFTVGSYTNHALVCTSKFDALIYRFGIVENDDATNYDSAYSNDVQGHFYDGIDTTTPTTHNMLVEGGNSANKSWYSGNSTVKYIASSNPLGIGSGSNYVHEYEITQEFVINPVFIESFKDALDNGLQPDSLIGSKSWKHVTHYEFRYDMSNPNTSQKITDETAIGSVGWFGENYNGFNSAYSISNVTYQDTTNFTSVDSLQLNRKTTVLGRVNGSGFTNTSKLGGYFFWGAPLEVYSNKQTSFQNTFLWDSFIGSMSSGTYEATGSDRIKRLKLTYISASVVDFEMDIEFSQSEIDLINPDNLSEVFDNYFIGVQAGNTNTTDTSNKVICQVDWNAFNINLDVEGLCRFENQGFFDHSMDTTLSGFTDYKGWLQDGIVFKSDIILNKSLSANLKAVQCRLIAYNTLTDDSFDLQSYKFSLANQVIVNQTPTYQKLSLSTTRGFKLASGDAFNQVTLFFNNPASNEQRINLKLGVKIDWQSWIKINADTIFFDASLDSNGLGKDASRYSLLNDYEIRLVVDADINTDSTLATRYSDMSPSLNIYGWTLEDDDPAEYSCLIETFDEDNNDLGGAILENADTRMKVTWTPQSGSTSIFTNGWFVHRLETINANSYNDINELSSILTPTLSRLKPLLGETLLKVTDNGTNFVTECLIDYTKLNGQTINLSARMGRYKVYPYYNIARDIKLYSEGSYIYINVPDNGVAQSNSLRIGAIDNDKNIVSETAIPLSASYTYQNAKIAVAYNIIVNGQANFYIVTNTGTTTDLHEFIYNGSAYVQTRIFSSNIGVGSQPCIRIDNALEPNSKPYIWFGSRDANIGGQKGFKHAYHNGTSWQFTDFKTYDSASPTNAMCAHPTDVNFDSNKIYIMNYDNPPQSTQYNDGKIAVYTQTSGSTTTPADRTNFANYTLSYNIYRNTLDTENEDGAGNVGDLAYGVGFEQLGIDSNSNPIFLIVHDASLGGRHFSRVYTNTATPTSEADWIIQTPMASTNGLSDGTQAVQGSASALVQSSNLSKKHMCQCLVIDANDFVVGHHSRFYWVRHKITDWTGATPNKWWIYTPNDPQYDFTSGNTLIE